MRYTTRLCSIDGCDGAVTARGWCHRHYYRWHRTGDPTLTKRPDLEQSLDERFWAKVNGGSIDDCWLWTAYRTKQGYGRFWTGSTMAGAHQYAYTTLIGPVPDGLELDHLCHVRHCVNPWHMEPVTHEVNMDRSANILLVNAAKIECPQGHAYTEANTCITTSGGRQCRTCETARKRVSA